MGQSCGGGEQQEAGSAFALGKRLKLQRSSTFRLGRLPTAHQHQTSAQTDSTSTSYIMEVA